MSDTLSPLTKLTVSPDQDAPCTFDLPDNLRHWPWLRVVNPHFNCDESHDESFEWLETFSAFSSGTLAAFKKSKFTLFSALAWPDGSSYTLRSICDMNHLLFAIEEFTDGEPLDIVIQRCNATMDAILHPDAPRPDGESSVGEMARQFWKRAIDGEPIPTGVVQRFHTTWREYLDSVILQAERRGQQYVCTLDEYIAARRDNAGAAPCLVWIEQALGLDLPDAVMKHPLIETMHRDVLDIVTMTNDLRSYRKEVLANDFHYNAVTVVAKHLNTDLAGAIQWISDYHDRSAESFMRAREAIIARAEGTSQWSEEDHKQILRYIDGLGLFVRGHDEWYFDSHRYFGEKGEEVKRTRKVVIEP